MTIEIPQHLRPEWPIWRVASSPRFASSLREIQEHWNLDDLYDANAVLDLWEQVG